MHYTVSVVDSTKRYEFTFEDNTSCAFSVSKTGIIFIEVKEYIQYEYLCSALDEVSLKTAEEGLTPTINIKNSNKFLKVLATKTGFKKVPCNGISFSVWVKR